MSTKHRRRHSPDQIVRKLRDADAMLNAGKELAAVLQALEVSESTLERWRKQYGGMKSEEAVRLRKLEDETKPPPAEAGGFVRFVRFGMNSSTHDGVT